jgi:hypothetical protein
MLVLKCMNSDKSSPYDNSFIYPEAGEIVRPQAFSDNPECGNGLHGIDPCDINCTHDILQYGSLFVVIDTLDYKTVTVENKIKFAGGRVLGYYDNVEEVRQAFPDWSKDWKQFGVSTSKHAVMGNYSTLKAWYNSTLKAGDNSTLIAGYNSTLTAGDKSTLTAGGYSTLTACDDSTLTAGGYSTLTAGNNSNLKAGSNSTLKVGYNSTLTAGNYSTLTSQSYSTLTAGSYSTLKVYNNCMVEVENNCTITCYGTKIKVKSGNNCTLTMFYDGKTKVFRLSKTDDFVEYSI